MGAQKCANDVQISLERAFPHCVRVFKARKKAPRNTVRRTKRRLRVTIAPRLTVPQIGVVKDLRGPMGMSVAMFVRLSV